MSSENNCCLGSLPYRTNKMALRVNSDTILECAKKHVHTVPSLIMHTTLKRKELIYEVAIYTSLHMQEVATSRLQKNPKTCCDDMPRVLVAFHSRQGEEWEP